MATSAGAQSLSLSYKLDPTRAHDTPAASPIVNRCSGLNWAATLAAACIAEVTASRVAHAVAALRAEASPSTEASADPRRLQTPSADFALTESSPRRYELPMLGSPSEARVIRAAGGRDDYIGSARNVDFNFRFGSKYRMRSGEQGWEVYKYSDVTSENKLGSSGMKAVGVELLVPFQ